MYYKILFLAIVISDVLSKWLINTYTGEYAFLGGIAHITRIKNTGIAFGTPLPGIHIIIPCILLGLGIFVMKSWQGLEKYEKVGYTCILTGGALNALERALFGSVTDMISLEYFAVFNVADIAVTMGACLLIVTGLLSRKKAL